MSKLNDEWNLYKNLFTGIVKYNGQISTINNSIDNLGKTFDQIFSQDIINQLTPPVVPAVKSPVEVVQEAKSIKTELNNTIGQIYQENLRTEPNFEQFRAKLIQIKKEIIESITDKKEQQKLLPALKTTWQVLANAALPEVTKLTKQFTQNVQATKNQINIATANKDRQLLKNTRNYEV